MNYLYGKNIKNKICSMTRTRRANGTSDGAAAALNAGFSFIEMIVVVLVIAIAASAAVMSLSAALRANTTRAAAELSSVISEARLESMSRPAGSVELHIYQSSDDGKFYADIVMKKNADGSEKVIESKAVASGAVTINASSSSTTPGRYSTITSSNTAVITFEKSTGKLSSFAVGTGSGYDSIVISGAKTSTVKIVKNTGRSYVE